MIFQKYDSFLPKTILIATLSETQTSTCTSTMISCSLVLYCGPFGLHCPPQKKSNLIIVLPRRELLGPLTYGTVVELAGLSKLIHCKTDNRWKNRFVSCLPYRTRTPKSELTFRSLQKRKQSKVRQGPGVYCLL